MGRVERLLLALLALCAACVGAMTWQSAGKRVQVANAKVEPSARVSGSASGASAGGSAANTPRAEHVRSEVVRSALSAPPRDVAELRGRISASASGTYIEHLLAANDSMLTRWPEREVSPIRVWIENDSPAKGWSQEMILLAERAFLAWRELNVPLRFDFVQDSSQAEMLIRWTNYIDASHVGETKRTRDQHGWIVRAEIVLALNHPSGAPLEPQYLRAIAIHEIGHALGVDHSPSASDIMAARNKGVFEPTGADRATLSLIYALPPGSVR